MSVRCVFLTRAALIVGTRHPCFRQLISESLVVFRCCTNLFQVFKRAAEMRNSSHNNWKSQPTAATVFPIRQNSDTYSEQISKLLTRDIPAFAQFPHIGLHPQ